MKSNTLIASLAALCIATAAVFGGCSKKNSPQPSKTDTIYAPQPDTTVNLTKGLLLYLPFSDNIADSSGNANPTQAVGGNVLTYDAHGYPNSAFGATGNGQEVVVSNNGSIKFDTAFALSFGLMVNTSNVQQAYLSLVDPATGYGPSILVGTTFYPGVPFLVDGINDITSGCSVYGSVNNVNIADTTNFAPIPGSWYNVVLVYHKGSSFTYVNGSLVGTRIGTGTEAQLCAASKFIVGGWWNGNELSFNGKLDNIRLYNRVLTPHEIAALASNYQVTSNSVKATPITAH